MTETQEEKTITVTMTRRVTQAWKDSARENGAKAKAVVQSEEHRAKLRTAQSARRERERQEKTAAGLLPVAVEKKRPGRPRKQEGTTA
jgi:hypothetical protein